MRILYFVMGLVLLHGCSTVGTSHRPDDYYQNQNNASTSDASLFGESADGLNEEAIQKILAYRLALPVQSRIAIFNLSRGNYWNYYSSDFIHLDEETVKGLITHLRGSPRVYDASFLPNLLMPEKMRLPNLRVAAARYQADILLAYRTKCQSFEKYKMIDPNIVRIYCTVEAVALDVRSGIVPFDA